MLTSAQSIVRYDFRDGTVAPDRLTRAADRHYLAAARSMLSLYRRGEGATRRTLHRRVDTILDRLGDCPPRRAAAFCKLLDDLGEYRSAAGTARTLRERVFEFGARFHPLVERREGIFDSAVDEVRRRAAEAIGRPWKEIEADLFADVLELQRLESFPGDWPPEKLLSLYNTAQTQAALFRATRVRIDAAKDFKTILRHAKLAGLMHRIRPLRVGDRDGYRFLFDGPQSGLRETTRYGVRFAAMLPKLLTCEGWQLIAEVLGPRQQPFRLKVSPADGLRGVLERDAAFDSGLEQDIDAWWHRDPIEGWTWKRESELLVCGQTVMTPDFVLRHQRHARRIFVEVVGYWTPEYLEEKCRRLRQFLDAPAAAGSTRVKNHWLLVTPPKCTPEQRRQLGELPICTLPFDRKASPRSWLRTLGLVSQD